MHTIGKRFARAGRGGREARIDDDARTGVRRPAAPLALKVPWRQKDGMAAIHQYEVQTHWRKPADASTNAMNHRLEFSGRPPLESSGAPQYKGDASKVNPEELFVAALVSCQMLSYLALAGRAGVDVLAYDDAGTGTMTIADKRMRITEVRLRPRITIAAGSDAGKARALVEAAHDACFIANSVACAVEVEPEIVVG
jgi:organic hydroperoxide reductase OsmC/OhrA